MIYKKSEVATEFFVKAMYAYFTDQDSLADYFIKVANLSAVVETIHQKEVLDKMN